MWEENPHYLLWIVLLFQWIVYLWNEYLTYRQKCVVRREKTVPPQLASVLDQNTLEKSRLYSLDKATFSFWQGLYSEIETTVMLLVFALPWVWGKSGLLLGKIYAGAESSEILQSLLFVLLLSVYSLITGLPWSVYSTFVLEARHSFNKQTPGFFIKDTLKKFVVTQVIMMPLLALLIWIVRAGGDLFFVYAWLFTLAISVLLITLYPSYIAPLFDKYTRLPEAPLRSSIETLAASLKFPLEELFLVEGSKRSSHSNAYFVGLLKKRIVLFDTLLSSHHPDNQKKTQDPDADTPDDKATPQGEGDTDSTNQQVIVVNRLKV